MKTFRIIFILAVACGFLSVSAQKPVDLRINTVYGFSDPDGNKDIVVNFPGKTAHEIYTMMAVNIGVLYYEPDEVMYGVEDTFISVCGSDNDFCRSGDNKWSAKYILKFIIKDGKVLLLNPSIKSLKTKDNSSYSYYKELDFIDFINQYWYNKETQQFITAESTNRRLCQDNITDIINIILGIKPMKSVPENW